MMYLAPDLPPLIQVLAVPAVVCTVQALEELPDGMEEATGIGPALWSSNPPLISGNAPTTWLVAERVQQTVPNNSPATSNLNNRYLFSFLETAPLATTRCFDIGSCVLQPKMPDRYSQPAIYRG